MRLCDEGRDRLGPCGDAQDAFEKVDFFLYLLKRYWIQKTVA